MRAVTRNNTGASKHGDNHCLKDTAPKSGTGKSIKFVIKASIQHHNLSDDDKQQFRHSQQNVSIEEVVQRVKNETGINDDKKAQQTAQEGVKLLQEKTCEERLLENMMERFKGINLNPFDSK